MSSYIHFTEQEKEQARKTDLVDLLRKQGETLKKSGKEFQWKDGYEKVTVRGNVWYNQYKEVDGEIFRGEQYRLFEIQTKQRELVKNSFKQLK